MWAIANDAAWVSWVTSGGAPLCSRRRTALQRQMTSSAVALRIAAVAAMTSAPDANPNAMQAAVRVRWPTR